MKIKEKMGNFMEEHGGELIVCGGMILAYAVGLTVGTKNDHIAIQRWYG